MSDAELSQFFCLAGVSRPQVRQAKAVKSKLLGNFCLFPAFSDFAEHWNFRTSWVTLGGRACLLERNAKRHDASDASFLSRELEVTDCQLDFTKQHWSESEIISLFSHEEIHLSVHDAFITCLDTDRSLVASSKLETTLREDDKRAQYLISSYRNGDAGRAQHPCEEIKDPLRAGSGNLGESLVSLHEKAAHGERRSSCTEEFEQERVSRGLQACTHPKEYQTKGANQHGTWTRCSLCQTKTGYQKYGPDNPPPKTKGAVVETYVASEAMGTTRVPMGASSSESPQPLMPDLETAFRGQNQQLVQSTAAVMAQVMTPVVEGFHQALRYQAEESQRAQERQETQMQQSFLALQRIMQQTDPARQPGAAFPALPPEELHRLLAQGFAMASQHPLPEDEDWDSVQRGPPHGGMGR